MRPAVYLTSHVTQCLLGNTWKRAADRFEQIELLLQAGLDACLRKIRL
jgi:hypothetical protein